MKNDPTVTNIFDLEGRRYPHLKITNEDFPRVLATRAIEDDGAEYFGAFLTKTAVRILIDYLNRRFRLRSCDIDIDGTFSLPCTQYYRRRCVAPCVAAFCSRPKYLERVVLVRLFLANDRRRFRSLIRQLIATNSDELDFEEAAVYRDILESAERHWKQPRWHLWLDDAIDTYEIEETPTGFTVYLVTTRGRTVLGRKVFDVPREEAPTPDEALSQIIGNFYVTHLPKEIRAPVDFYGRKGLIERFTNRFGRPAVISVGRGRGVNATRALLLGRDEHELDRAWPRASAERISARLAHIFRLGQPPRRAEAFDVAHISGTGFVSASSAWESGRYISADYRFTVSEQKTELSALANAVASRLCDPSMKTPDLLILDGGKPQLKAVTETLRRTNAMQVPLIAAVKPRGRHSSIAAFLTTDGESVRFDVDSPAHAMLQLLRDEAHDLANRVHRDYREMMPFYEKAGFETPLVVPLRFHAENGGADDLIPIAAR